MTKIKSPQAQEVKCFQDENGHWIMNIKSNLPDEPIETLAHFSELPVWVSHSNSEKKPSIYEEVFSGIPITGEYLYYFAGNLAKDEGGWLDAGKLPASGEHHTSFEVFAKFEDDLMTEDMKDDALEKQEIAIANAAVINFAEGFIWGRLGDIENFFESYQDKIDCEGTVYTTVMKDYAVPDLAGMGSMIFSRCMVTGAFLVRLSFEQYRQPQSSKEFERYLSITASASDPNMELGQFYAHFHDLIVRYADMPYVAVSGTTRI